ncbi:archaellin/type IV pilin N-terminal domain-containing protein [Natrialbaceae archaeon A-CW2]
MFEKITDENERGQVGIGTLIVFIAMVLVAAIAAGVLINTAGSLQSQASDTGTETQQAVANQIEVVSATGNVSDSANELEELNLVIKKSAGSDVIDVTDLTVQYTNNDVSAALQYDDDDGTDGFTTEQIIGSDAEADSLTSTSDRIRLNIDLSAAEGPFDSDQFVPEGGSATIELVDQSGATFSYGVTAPATFGDKTVVEV